MSNSVVLKGSKYGIMIILDDETPFDLIKEELAHKFSQASVFFRNADIAVSFTGRPLQYWEEKELVDVISDNSMVNIMYVASDDEHDKLFEKFTSAPVPLKRTGLFYKGTLHAGQILESASSVIILGDVCAGAKIISNGNVVIIGALEGTVYAGLSDSKDAFIAALSMSPQQIRIGEITAGRFGRHTRSADERPLLAYSSDGNIYLQEINDFHE